VASVSTLVLLLVVALEGYNTIQYKYLFQPRWSNTDPNEERTPSLGEIRTTRGRKGYNDDGGDGGVEEEAEKNARKAAWAAWNDFQRECLCGGLSRGIRDIPLVLKEGGGRNQLARVG
jgi:hypothetical protein